MSAIVGSPRQGSEQTTVQPPSPPRPPADTEAMKTELGGLKDQLQKNPNDADAKQRLAGLEREVSNEFGAEQQKGDKADLKQLDSLEAMLNDVHQTMDKHGVQELPRGGAIAV